MRLLIGHNQTKCEITAKATEGEAHTFQRTVGGKDPCKIDDVLFTNVRVTAHLELLFTRFAVQQLRIKFG